MHNRGALNEIFVKIKLNFKIVRQIRFSFVYFIVRIFWASVICKNFGLHNQPYKMSCWSIIFRGIFVRELLTFSKCRENNWEAFLTYIWLRDWQGFVSSSAFHRLGSFSEFPFPRCTNAIRISPFLSRGFQLQIRAGTIIEISRRSFIDNEQVRYVM